MEDDNIGTLNTMNSPLPDSKYTFTQYQSRTRGQVNIRSNNSYLYAGHIEFEFKVLDLSKHLNDIIKNEIKIVIFPQNNEFFIIFLFFNRSE